MTPLQNLGLRPDAYEFLSKYAKKAPSLRCPNCGYALEEMIVEHRYSKITGMFDDKVDLFEYELMECEYVPDGAEQGLHIADGTKVREVHQTTTWSGGPCIFLNLELEDGTPLFLWDEDDIDEV